MKKLIKQLENIMVAVTFAEAGEYDEASRQSEHAAQSEEAGGLRDFKKAALESSGK